MAPTTSQFLWQFIIRRIISVESERLELFFVEIINIATRALSLTVGVLNTQPNVKLDVQIVPVLELTGHVRLNNFTNIAPNAAKHLEIRIVIIII
jgi:hypothetical protein